MPKIAFLLTFLTLGSFLHAQPSSLTVTGSVTYSDGTPVAGVDVFISTVFDDSTFFFVNSLTNDAGIYEEVIPIPDGQTEGEVSFSIIGCNGTFDYYTQQWNADDTVLVQDFIWCEIVTMDSCFVLILESYDPLTGEVVLYALGSAFEPITYLWNDGSTGQWIVPTEDGTYCVTITGSDGCTTSGCYEYIAGGSGCFVSISSGNGMFFDTALYAFGYGVEPITYVWSTGDTGQVLVVNEEGEYCVTLTDAIGCTSSACIYYVPLPCFTWINWDWQNSLSADAFGAAPFTYLWSTGETTQTINPTEDGVYCVTTTDAEGCESSACIDYYEWSYCDVFLSYGSDPSNGTIDSLLYAYSIGIPPFTYIWSTGDTTEGISIDSLVPGICVTVTDATGCVDSACTDEFFEYCYGWIEVVYVDDSTAVLTATTYPFDQGGSYVWSTGDSSQTITVTEVGEYCVTIQTEFGCFTTACAYIDFYIYKDSCYAWINAYVDPSTGQYTLEAYSIGVFPLTYEWSTGDTTATITIDPPSEPVCVTVTDATGCSYETCIVTQDPGCYVWIDAFPVDTAQWQLSAYAGPFLFADSYLWSNGATTADITVNTAGEYCVTITNVDGCSASACVYVDPANDTMFWPGIIHGYAIPTGNEQLTGTVELYNVGDPMTGVTWELIGTTDLDADNFYAFPNVAPGVYAVRVIAEPLNSTQEYLPTWYYHSVQWEKADRIVIPNNLTVLYDVLLLPADIIDGPGVISGILDDPNNILSSAINLLRSGGLGNISILLYDQNGKPLRHTLTGPDGSFIFEGLPVGAYMLKFEVGGVSSPELWVTISAESPIVNGITLSSSEISASGTTDVRRHDMRIAPQPVSDQCRLEIDRKIQGEHVVEVIGMDGRIERTFENIFDNSREAWIDVKDLGPGMYVVQMKSGVDVWLTKLIKQQE